MRDINQHQARTLATNAMNKLANEHSLGDLIIIDAAIIETEDAWFFPYDTTAFVLHGDVSSALAGNLPVTVSRDGSVVTVTYEAPPVSED